MPPTASPNMVTWRGDILTNWALDAACRGVVASPESDDFFGVSESAPMSRAEVASSKFICQRLCPVQRDCLRAALAGEEEWGVWGGLTAPERKRAKDILGSNRAIIEAFDDETLYPLVVRRG